MIQGIGQKRQSFGKIGAASRNGGFPRAANPPGPAGLALFVRRSRC